MQPGPIHYTVNTMFCDSYAMVRDTPLMQTGMLWRLVKAQLLAVRHSVVDSDKMQHFNRQRYMAL